MIRGEKHQRAVKTDHRITMLPAFGRKKLLDYADSFRDIAKTYMMEHAEESDIERQQKVYQQKILENREILAEQLTQMADMMSEVAVEAFDVIGLSHKKQKQIIQILKSHGIVVQTIYMMQQKNGLLEVSIMMKASKNKHFQIEDIAGVLSVLLNRRFIPDKNCMTYIRDLSDIYVFQEEAKYGIFTGIAKAIKENERMSGDNYSFCDMNGSYLCVISDGMGSGEKAYEASAMVINLLEKLLEAGFETERAIHMINGALIANGEECNTSTLDLCSIDLHTGVAEFYKIGGSDSYIKRTNGVEILEEDSLPMGYFQQLDISSRKVQLTEGDYIVMVSDGVLDALKSDHASEQLRDVIEEIELENPREIANYILQYVIHYAGGKIKDDMIIEVAGIYRNEGEATGNGS